MKSLRRQGKERVGIADLRAEVLQMSGMSVFEDFEECVSELREAGEVLAQKDDNGRNLFRLNTAY